MPDNSNPLFNISHPIPFDQVKPEHVAPAIRELLRLSKLELQSIIDEKVRTYENTLIAFDRLAEKLTLSWRVVKHLENVAPAPTSYPMQLKSGLR
ncbi:MAG: hypothetical protein R3A13_00530 [Bdellovibrionota bacterium]